MTRIEKDAGYAWGMAYTARHDGNWGRAVDAMNKIRPLLKAPHPKVRRVAEPFFPYPEMKEAA